MSYPFVFLHLKSLNKLLASAVVANFAITATFLLLTAKLVVQEKKYCTQGNICKYNKGWLLEQSEVQS